ncbi:MAG: ribonuclease HII [Chlamydiales bacterium]|nr:ribonuclease HII [Chlamydiales bacterium]
MHHGAPFYYEQMARKIGYQIIAGIDEAGRGPLAGPVVAAACILPMNIDVSEIDDSKKLSKKKRSTLYHQLINNKDVIIGVGIVDAATIDDINILQATFQAMQQAVSSLPIKPDFLLIDGNRSFTKTFPHQTIVAGDAKSASIAAASIIAKYTRDQIMEEYHKQYPSYGFDEHYGYATKLHVEALKSFGPCDIHRKSFAPIRQEVVQFDFFS